MSAPSEDMIVANGLRHHVLRWGKGPIDVLLCHGFLDIAWSFDALARALTAEGHVVAAFDWRGHGQSDWIGPGGYYHFPDYTLDLDELVPQLSTTPIHLVGHSMGGTAAAMYAAARPERLRTLSLIEGLGPPDVKPRNAAKRLAGWLDGVGRVRAKQPTPMANSREALRRMRLQNPELTEELGLFLVAKATRPVDGGIEWTFDPLHKTGSPRPFRADVFGELLESIAAPTLVVSGARGFRLQDEQARIARIAKRSFVEIADVGHMIHWFEPRRLASELASFFARHGA